MKLQRTRTKNRYYIDVIFNLWEPITSTCIGLVDCAYKRWLSNTNFGNPANWNAGRAPCGNDVAVIHDESAAVFLQVNTTVKQLVSGTKQL